MANKTSIEWTDWNWNFLRGCSRVSSGCKNCYAEKMAARFSGEGLPYHGIAKMVGGEARWTGEVSFHEDILLAPLKRRKPTTYFVNSMSDLFHEKVKDEWLDKAFAVMALTPQHTYQILTKRPERMRDWFNERWQPATAIGETDWSGRHRQVLDEAETLLLHTRFGDQDRFWTKEGGHISHSQPWPLPNVWLGVSVEDQKTADERIPLLLQTPAAVRWISYEPALGSVDFTNLTSRHEAGAVVSNFNAFFKRHTLNKGYPWPGLDWIVVGGESGPRARPFNIQWARDIIAQCKAAGVPVFIKQLGTVLYGSRSDWEFLNVRPLQNFASSMPLNLKDRKGGDMSEWPEDLRIRQMPEATGTPE